MERLLFTILIFRAQHLPLLKDVLPFIQENMAIADIVKASNEDFRLICGANDAYESKDWMNQFSSALLIYTANKDGVSVIGNESYFFAVPQIDPISTVGAGDTFNAAIAYYLIRSGFGKSEIEKLNEIQITELVEIAVQFSQEVCMGYDNFLSWEFASKYK